MAISYKKLWKLLIDKDMTAAHVNVNEYLSQVLSNI